MSLRSLPDGYVMLGPDRAVRASPAQPVKRGVDPGPEGEASRDWLADLMERPRFAGRLSAEEALSVACADELRRLTVERALDCVWFRVPNEHSAGGSLGKMHQAKAAAMGVVRGAPDFAFLWDGGAGGIELKVEKTQGRLVVTDGRLAARAPGRTYQTGFQPDVEHWFAHRLVRYELARSVREMLEILRVWGRIL